MKNTFTRFPDKALDVFCHFRVPGEVRQIIDCIIRRTYGYNEEEELYSNSQLVIMTGMDKGNVHRALSKATTHNLVVISDNKLKLNENYSEWISFKKLSKVTTHKTVVKSDNKPLSKVTTHSIYIDNRHTKKEKKSTISQQKSSESHPDYRPNISHSNLPQKNIQALPYDKLWEMAMKKNVSLADVKKTHQSILDSIEDGDKYKVKNILLTLNKWIDLGIARGNIQYLDEIGKMILEDDSPQRIEQRKVYREAVKYINATYAKRT